MAINPAISALLKEFATTQNLVQKSEPEQFEHFVNYIVLADSYHSEIDVVSLSTGDHEFGVDGIAVVSNGSMIDSADEVDEHCNFNKYLKSDFYFIQSKLSSNFDSGDMLKLFNAIDDFFNPQAMTLSQGDDVKAKWDIKQEIYAKAGYFIHGLPNLRIIYATLGQFKDDKNITS